MKPTYKKPIFTAVLSHDYTAEFNIETYIFSIKDKKGETLKKIEYITSMTLSCFLSILEDAERTAVAWEKLKPNKDKALAIANDGKGWFIIGNGSFITCGTIARKEKPNYKETKAIYEFNSTTYGIKL